MVRYTRQGSEIPLFPGYTRQFATMIDQRCTTDGTESRSLPFPPTASASLSDPSSVASGSGSPAALASEITAAPYDVTLSYGADWTIELLRKPAQMVADRIMAMMKELQPASPAAHFRPPTYRSEERRSAERSSLDEGTRIRHSHSVLCPQDAVETIYISELCRPEGDNPCL